MKALRRFLSDWLSQRAERNEDVNVFVLSKAMVQLDITHSRRRLALNALVRNKFELCYLLRHAFQAGIRIPFDDDELLRLGLRDYTVLTLIQKVIR